MISDRVCTIVAIDALTQKRLHTNVVMCVDVSDYLVEVGVQCACRRSSWMRWAWRVVARLVGIAHSWVGVPPPRRPHSAGNGTNIAGTGGIAKYLLQHLRMHM